MSGSMGYGVPAAVAAKVVHPERLVISWNGDGCFLMNGQELATAVQYGLDIVFVVVDNGMYGTIRMHQERTYPGREYGTALVNPGFRSAGARIRSARRDRNAHGRIRACVRARCRRRAGPALLHLKLDPQALTMNATLDALREQGVAARKV